MKNSARPTLKCLVDYKERMREEIARKLPTNNEESSIEEDWKQFKEAVTTAVEEVAGVKINYGTKKKCTPWWNEEVKTAVKKKMASYRKWMRTRRPEDRLTCVRKE